jgi:hypothetical protein
MSTTVIATPTLAANRSIGVIGATNWTNVSNAIGSDDTYATNNYGGSTSPAVTNHLHVYGFGFSLSDASIIEGIKVEIERHGTDSSEDYYVGLIYNNLAQITAPGKQLSGPWLSPDSTVSYGGLSDTWGRTWTPDQINDSTFGVAISAERPLSGSGSANVDHIIMTLVYTQVINYTPTTGGKCGGSALLDCNYQSFVPSGGCKIGGDSLLPLPYDIVSAGMAAGGDAVHQTLIGGQGGGAVGGASDPDATYNVSETVRGAKNGNTAATGAVYDLVTSGGLNAGSSIRLLFIEKEFGSGGLAVGGEALLGEIPATNGGIVFGSTSIVSVITSRTVSGGIKAAGAPFYQAIWDSSITGGAALGGTVLFGVYQSVGGGLTCGGDGQRLMVFIPPHSGGATLRPSYTLVQTYASQGQIGGLRAGGRVAAERLAYYTETHFNYGYAMASQNIFNTPVITDQLIDPFPAVAPPVASTVRTEETADWCEFPDPCESGYLPEVVKKRQREYLPPKNQ